MVLGSIQPIDRRIYLIACLALVLDCLEISIQVFVKLRPVLVSLLLQRDHKILLDNLQVLLELNFDSLQMSMEETLDFEVFRAF